MSSCAKLCSICPYPTAFLHNCDCTHSIEYYKGRRSGGSSTGLASDDDSAELERFERDRIRLESSSKDKTGRLRSSLWNDFEICWFDSAGHALVVHMLDALGLDSSTTGSATILL